MVFSLRISYLEFYLCLVFLFLVYLKCGFTRLDFDIMEEFNSIVVFICIFAWLLLDYGVIVGWIVCFIVCFDIVFVYFVLLVWMFCFVEFGLVKILLCFIYFVFVIVLLRVVCLFLDLFWRLFVMVLWFVVICCYCYEFVFCLVCLKCLDWLMLFYAGFMLCIKFVVVLYDVLFGFDVFCCRFLIDCLHVCLIGRFIYLVAYFVL